MRVSIKIEPSQKEALFNMKRPGDDYSDVVGRLLNLYDLLDKASPLFAGGAEFWRVTGGRQPDTVAKTLDGKPLEIGKPLP